jgi:hypothetical protein
MRRRARRSAQPLAAMPTDTVSLNDLSKRLRIKMPKEYSSALQRMGVAALASRQLDPESLLILNLKLRGGLFARSRAARHRLYLADEGGGNYFFFDLAGKSPRFGIRWHDPPGVEWIQASFAEFLEAAEPVSEADEILPKGDLVVTKASSPRRSVLDPISLLQWKSVLKQYPQIEFMGYLPGKNPFTGALIKMRSPGCARLNVGKTSVLLELTDGAICARKVPRRALSLMQRVATDLKARVFHGG